MTEDTTLADDLFEIIAARVHAMDDAELTRQITVLRGDRLRGCRMSILVFDLLDAEWFSRHEVGDTDPATTFMDLASLGDDDEPITAKDTPTSKSQDRLEAVRPEEEPPP